MALSWKLVTIVQFFVGLPRLFNNFAREEGSCSYLVVQRQLGESRYELSPLHEEQQLLLHRVAHVVNVGDLLVGQVAVVGLEIHNKINVNVRFTSQKK